MKTTTMKTELLEGATLDWAVAQVDAQSDGLKWVFDRNLGTFVGVAEVGGDPNTICAFLGAKLSVFDFRKRILLQREGAVYYRPSADWSQGGPLIARHRVSIVYSDDECDPCAWTDETAAWGAPCPLIAAMRAIVAANLGATVEVPTELAGSHQ